MSGRVRAAAVFAVAVAGTAVGVLPVAARSGAGSRCGRAVAPAASISLVWPTLDLRTV